MKKTYIKPEIILEDFSLSTNIAGDCGEIIDTVTSGICGIELPGTGIVFVNGVVDCTNGKGDIPGYPLEDIDPSLKYDASYNGICYHVPSDANNLFNS